MSASISSKRYAQAAFQIAKGRKELDKWKSNLSRIALLMQDSEFADIIQNPKMPFDLKSKYTEEKLKGIDSLALNLAFLLIHKNKMDLIDQIAEEYGREVDEYHGIKRADVISAISMDDEHKKKLGRQLEDLTGSKLSIKFEIDPAIVGGFVAKIDGKLIDGSVRNKLKTLKDSMSGINK